jgi:O-antigen/teichoic acid export membrane protein
MVGVAISYVAAILGQALVAIDRQRDVFLYGALFVLPLNLVVNLALIPVLGNTGAALAYAVTEVVAVALIMVVYNRVAKVPRFHQPLRVAAAGCVMAVVAPLQLLPGVVDASPIPILAVGGTLSLALYVGALYLFQAMPPEIHSNLLAPLWTRLRPRARAAR